MKSLLCLLFLALSISVNAQVAINTDGSLPDNSAGLDVKFNNKGFLPPRLTHAQMDSIVSPANGLIIYCSDCSNSGNGALAMFMNGMWYMFASTCIVPLFPSAGIHVPDLTQVVWNWNTVAGATGYRWNTTNDFASATDMAALTTKTETELNCNTAYTRYAWAYSACGNSTPVTLSRTTLICPIPCDQQLTDTRDGKTYTTVLIGTQCWIAQNLNVGTRIAGTTEQTNNSVIEKYCYSNSEAQCDVYGGLYQWDEMMNYSTTHGVQGICPTGWHLPTNGEWTALTSFLGGENIAGGKVKETGNTHWLSPNTGATNSSGFTALPGSFRNIDGSFDFLGMYGYFWSSTEYSTTMAWQREMPFDNTFVIHGPDPKDFGSSVRCLKGEIPTNYPPLIPTSPSPENGAQTQTFYAHLSWTCTDPDSDPLSFDVYFGTESTPPQVATGQVAATFDPGILNNNTEYFWKIIAHDEHGNTTEGPVWSFTWISWPCGSPITDTRDGKTYTTVQIGTQCWMSQNLNVGIRIAGTEDQYSNNMIEKYCYSNSEAQCDIYGGLYQWNEMMNYSSTPGVQGICPTDWHLPTDAEWCTLTTYLDATVDCSAILLSGTDVGGKMKEAGTTHWNSPNTGATNSSGFTGLPGGFRYNDGTFGNLGIYGGFLSSTQGSGTSAWARTLNYSNTYVNRNKLAKDFGYSVRCLRN